MRVGSATCEGIVGWYGDAVALSFVCGSMTEPWGCSERAAVSFEMGVDIVNQELDVIHHGLAVGVCYVFVGFWH